MISEIVKKEFETRIKRAFNKHLYKEDIISFVINHPARERCFEKVVSELRYAQFKMPDLVTLDVIKRVAGDYALFFAKQVIMIKEKEIVSQAALIKQQKENDRIKEIQEGVANAEPAFDGDRVD